MSVRTHGRIQIIRHIFARQVRDGLDAKEWQVQRGRTPGHRSSFHIHGSGSGLAQAALFRGGLGYMIDGHHHSKVMRQRGGWCQGPEAAVGAHYFGGDDDRGHVQFLIQSAAKTRADDCLGPESRRRTVHRGCGSGRAGTVCHQQQIVLSQRHRASPIDAHLRLTRVTGMSQNAAKLPLLRRHHQQSHACPGPRLNHSTARASACAAGPGW